MFDMDGEETGTFAVPFAIVSHLAGFVMNLIVLGLIAALTAAAAAPTAPATVATPSGAAPAPAPPPQVAPGIPLQANARDREIERMIGSGLGVKDANEYNQSQPQKIKREPQLIASLYGAGAKRVYFDLGSSRAIVQLPDDAAARAKCFAIATAHRAAKGIEGSNATEQGQRYLEIDLDKPTGRARTR